MENQIESFFNNAEYQDSSLRLLTDFLEREDRNEQSGNYDSMRFIGYVLDLGFDTATIITSDPFKQAVGGVPRGSFLIMAPDSMEGMPPHFSLLRVTDTAPTPLSKDVQQTYFELHKKSMPDLDIWTKGELQWGAFSAKVLGMFFPDSDNPDLLRFSGDVNNVVSAHRYKVFSPEEDLLNLIVNGIVRQENTFPIGKLRLTECTLPFANSPQPQVDVMVSTNDFRGFRTAMFGKTRLGKSNVVKIIAQSIIETTTSDNSVGQIIFDINGEYANDNPQDGDCSIRSAYEDRCLVYALTPRESTPSRPLKLNFYEQPDACIGVIRSLLDSDNQNAQYVQRFANLELPNIEAIKQMPLGSERIRAIRKVQIYWAILNKAGFRADEGRLRGLSLTARSAHGPSHFSPHFNQTILSAVYDDVPAHPSTLDELQIQLEKVALFLRENPDHSSLRSSSGKAIFDPDDDALLKFLNPSTGGGPGGVLQKHRQYHDPNAGNFINEILAFLDEGKTVILDLGNASDKIREYFSDLLSRAIFSHQEQKFTSNNLGNHFIQLYFEEAHNIFPKDDNNVTGVYARFAKEGAKFHIGMVYSTQSPSTINKELLAQTENFFIAHMSSQGETDTLARLQIQFDGLQQDILKTRTPGYMRMITFSHRFVVPVQINKFEAVSS